jgi:glutathione S-transferase
MNVALIELFYAGEEWARLRRPGAREFATRRIQAVAKALGDKTYLDGDRFTAGDLLMSTVLRIIPDLITDPKLAAYVERCVARPAFKRALDAQLADFRADAEAAAS